MEQTQVAGNKYRPPEWTIYVLAVVADLLVAAGVIPSAHLTLFRSGALFLLHRDWFLGVACGFLLPQAVPLTLVCFLKHQWEAFKVSMFRLLSLPAFLKLNCGRSVESTLEINLGNIA